MDIKIDDKKNEKNAIIFLSITSIILVTIKWLFSYSLFNSEPLLNKVILDLEDHFYFAYSLFLSNLDFNPDYLINYYSDSYIPIPIYSLIFHSIFYLVFNEYSFIILEYFSCFLFLLIFLKIFQELNINIRYAMILAFCIFLLPDFLVYFKKLEINLINYDIIKNLYSFRIPRPLVSSIYFFWGLLLAVNYYKGKNTNIFFILIGINLALNFGSVYYNFIILSVLFFILFIDNILTNKKIIFFHFFKKNLIILIFFILFSMPFILLFILAEKDWLLRVGTIYPTFGEKIFFLNHILSKFLSLKFLLFFLITSLLFSYLIKKQKLYCKKTIKVLYLFFISSCISPILFIILSPNLTEVYHFIDLIVVIAILVSFIFILLILSIFFQSRIWIYKNLNFLVTGKFYILLVVLLFPIIFNLIYFINYKKNINYNFKKDMKIFYDYLYQDENFDKLNNILTFNTKIQVWWMYLGKKELSTIDSALLPLKTRDIESSFIDNLKFLKISKEDFMDLIKNKKTGWRYDNRYTKYLSWYKYQANSLITFNNSQNFEDDIFKFIKSSSPLFVQQIAIPNEEIERLSNLYSTHNSKLKNPDIIILEKDSLINKYGNVDLKIYCKIKKTNYLDIYFNLKKTNCNLL